MSIEPTEEQRAAAARFYYREQSDTGRLIGHVADWVETGAGCANVDADVRDLARLLAEREAKLRKQLAFMEAGSQADYNAFAEALQKEDAYLAEINLINERLAELEAANGLNEVAHLARISELYRDNEQHLLDIKALVRSCCVACCVAMDAIDDGDSVAARNELAEATERLAHYDDAKAAEGGEG